jgi:RNase P subunit RPR2
MVSQAKKLQQTYHQVRKRRNPTTRISQEKKEILKRDSAREICRQCNEMLSAEGKNNPRATKEMLTSKSKVDLRATKDMLSSKGKKVWVERVESGG